MNKQDYIENLKQDAIEWMDDNAESYDSFDNAWYDMELTITGNDCGSYYCNTKRAEESLAGVIWDTEVIDAVEAYGYEGIPMYKGAEAVDVIVRIALLGELYSELEEYYNEHYSENEDI